MRSTAILLLFVLISGIVAQTTRPAKPQVDPTQHLARVPGVLAGEADAVVVPAVIKANTDFELIVRTGGNGCWSKGDASLVLGEAAADIFVYDHTNATRPGTMCTMIYKQFDHKVTLRFAKKGEAVIRVWTRGEGDAPMGKPVVVEKRVIVK